jgi:hypothetical protein
MVFRSVRKGKEGYDGEGPSGLLCKRLRRAGLARAYLRVLNRNSNHEVILPRKMTAAPEQITQESERVRWCVKGIYLNSSKLAWELD